VKHEYDRIDVLAHNAGLSAGSRRESPDGIELTLAVNHLAPYLLTYELLEISVTHPIRVLSLPPRTFIAGRHSISTTYN